MPHHPSPVLLRLWLYREDRVEVRDGQQMGDSCNTHASAPTTAAGVPTCTTALCQCATSAQARSADTRAATGPCRAGPRRHQRWPDVEVCVQSTHHIATHAQALGHHPLCQYRHGGRAIQQQVLVVREDEHEVGGRYGGHTGRERKEQTRRAHDADAGHGRRSPAACSARSHSHANQVACTGTTHSHTHTHCAPTVGKGMRP